MADLITRQAAIDVLDRNHILGQGLLNDTLDHIADAIMALPSAQPDSKELSFTQKKLDTISRQAAIRWVKTECNPYGKPTLDFESGKKVIEHLKQMPSAQTEQLTDKEQRIFIAAMGREEKACKQVGDECRNCREPYEDSLVRTCHEITRKVKGALWMT